MNDATLAKTRGTGATAGVTPWDPSSIFLVKSLLYPTVATVSLGFALWLHEAELRPEYFLVAILAFVATSDVLDTASLDFSVSGAGKHRDLVQIAMQWFVVAGFIWTLIVLSGLTEHFERDVIWTWATVTPLALWLSRNGAEWIFRAIGLPHMPARKAAIVGRNALGALLADRLRDDPSLRIDVVGFFDDGQSPDGDCGSPALLGHPARLPKFIIEHDVRLVYITWPMAHDARIVDLLESLRDSTVSIYFVPDVSVASLIQGRVDVLNGIPVVGVCDSPFYGVRGLVKRMCDLFIASLAAIAATPLLIAVAAAVRLSSPGPILFKQRRYGLDGRKIVVYKFRTMTVTEDGENAYTQVTKNDARVTRIGGFLRKTSIDELPQLLNVLEGSMSLVGPRPHAIAVNEQYRRLISGYMVRHKVKPGITGWAQVNGARGGDDLDGMRRRVALDLDYLRNWSLGLDLAILLRTLFLFCKDRTAY
jgi:putative colanic acid biosynthesis UDP-glucose lipid carrier transferase